MSLVSRIAKLPVLIPPGVKVSFDGDLVTVQGSKATLVKKMLSDGVTLVINDKEAQVAVSRNGLKALSGTAAALLKQAIIGVTKGFERKLQLVGVGYRAQVQGKMLNLTLGFSHPVEFSIPEGITIETATPTEIMVKGSDKELVGLVASKIRAYRRPEPYKGKGIRYSDEIIKMKETKKK
jgi:large subunit ribosomal protein L6